MGVLITDRDYHPVDLPPQIGNFVIKTDKTEYKELVPCNSIVPKEIIEHSLPIVKKKFESGNVKCVPHDT